MTGTLSSQTWAGSVNVVTEIGLAAAGSASLWDTGLFNTATWGADLTWSDVSDDVETLKTTRACSRESGQYATATLSMDLDNSSWRYSEDNTAGPFYGQVRSGIPIRVRAMVSFPDGSSGIVPIFFGTVDAWDDAYPVAGRRSVVTIAASDVFEQLAAFDGFEQNEQGAGELSGARMHRILDNAGFSGDRAIDSGSVAMQSTTLASNALTELKLVADSEGGRLWAEPDGTVWFIGRYGLLENPRSTTPQVTFSDTAGSGVTYSAPKFTSSRDLQRSMVAYARKGGTTQQAVDPMARAVIGDRQLSRTDLVNLDDPSVLGLAQRDLALRQNAERRVDALTVEPLVQPDSATADLALRWLSSVRFWDRAQVVRHPDGAPFTISRPVFTTGLSHEFTSGNQWRVTVGFQSATLWASFTSSLFDSARFDSAAFTW